MLRGEYACVLAAKTPGDLQQAAVTFARRLEFETISVTTVLDRVDDEPLFSSVHNTPADYVSEFADPQRGKIDPVAQHCKSSNLPIVWDQSTYVCAGRPDLWEHQAAFGYSAGISVAVHLPRGQHVLTGVDRDQALGWSANELQVVVGALYLFTICAFEAGQRIRGTELPGSDFPSLTPRELEVLRWASVGKTAWETGVILSIAENTVNRHIANISEKLQCCGKRQSVVRAAQLGLL